MAVWSCEFCKSFKNTFFTDYLRKTASLSWNYIYNTFCLLGYGIITQGIPSFFSVIEISFIYLMVPIDCTNDQNTIGRVIYGFTYTLAIKIRIKAKIWNSLIFSVKLEAFAKFKGKRREFIRKRMYSLVNVKHY